MNTEALSARTRSHYDKVNYDSLPFDYSHPSRSAAVGVLLGMQPVAPSCARILEIGCAAGGNLIPLAVQYPNSQCVGIDLSERQIALGEAQRAELKLENLRLLAGDLMTMGDELGQFDYIIAHGLLSWVPGAVQDKIFELTRQLLSERGIAYISYNVYPGWHCWEIARHLMYRTSAHVEDPNERMAAALNAMRFFSEHALNSPERPLAGILKAHLPNIEKSPSYYVQHEYLEENNHPFYFRDFIHQAAKQELRYLGDTKLATLFVSNLPAAVQDYIGSVARHRYDQEELMDYVTGRMFRRSLLVHADIALDLHIEPERLMTLHFCADAKPSEVQDSPEVMLFVHGDSDDTRFWVKEPLSRVAMTLLGARFPASADIPTLLFESYQVQGVDPSGFDDDRLRADMRVIGQMLLDLLQKDLIIAEFEPRHMALKPGEYPCASPLVRQQAKSGREAVTSLIHHTVSLDEGGRGLLPLLDGTRSRQQLQSELARLMREKDIRLTNDPRSAAQQSKDPKLVEFLLNAFLDLFGQKALMLA